MSGANAVRCTYSLCLTVRQPWAWLIVHAGKDIENRNWPTRVRGRVLINAARGCTQDEYLYAADYALEAVADEYRGRGLVIPPWRTIERGGIVGSVEIVDCVEHSDSPWFMGRYGFVLRDPQPLPFEPCRGALGFWKHNKSLNGSA